MSAKGTVLKKYCGPGIQRAKKEVPYIGDTPIHHQPINVPTAGSQPPLYERECAIILHAGPVRIGRCHMSSNFFGSRTCRFPHDVFLHRFESSDDEINYTK